MVRFTWLAVLFAIAVNGHRAACAAEEPIRWLVEFEGQKEPEGAIWKRVGEPQVMVLWEGLRVADDTSEGPGGFRAPLKLTPGQELIVEARVKFESMQGTRGSASSIWPWRDGLPVGLWISDGCHQEGLVLSSVGVRYFSDRFHLLNTAADFHTYRLTIRERDMSLEVDGVRVIQGRNAFWKPADGPEAFVQFGSTAKAFTGSALWAHVKVGERAVQAPLAESPLKITLSQPWKITRDDMVRQTRPYLYNLGEGVLMLSVAQGPDALYEPYGVLKSLDAGKSWKPIAGLDQIESAPLPLIRRANGGILGVSRWCRLQEDGALVGHTVKIDAQTDRFEMFENRIELPAPFFPKKRGEVVVFERQIFEEADGALRVVVWSRIVNEQRQTVRHAHLLKSTDDGKTWRHEAAIIPGGEPAVAKLSPTDMTCVIRSGTWAPMHQSWSQDSGKTWSAPRVLEEGCVDPDLELMSNGVLACSYGRPTSCVMFSIDQGRTWIEHRVVSERAGFNYTSLREISPGRLLFVHDAPTLSGVYIDVERLDGPKGK